MAELGSIDPAWRAELEPLLRRHDLQGVAVIAIRRDGQIDAHTLGEDGGIKSRALARWIDGFIAHGLTIIPFQTVFGWGNAGVPKPLPPGRAAPAGWEEFAGPDPEEHDG